MPLDISSRSESVSANRERLDEFHRMATPGNKSTMTAYQTPDRSL
jgi:hypothetical protein